MSAIAQEGAIRRAPLVAALGVTQIFAWGSSYYLPAVLARPIASEMDWPLELVVGGLSLGSCVAGLVAPRVGKAIDRRGGRPVLSASAILLAAGLVLLGLAHAQWLYLLAWAVIGTGMACGLYDAAFGTLGRLLGREAGSSITSVTLFGGFASTVCWPLSAALVEHLGWRGTCFAYAGFHLLVSLTIYRLLVPGLPAVFPDGRSEVRPAGGTAPEPAAMPTSRRRLLVGAIMVIFTAHSMIVAVVSVHILALLQGMGLGLAAAVALGTLFGPAQVAARLLQFGIARRLDPFLTAIAAVGLLALGLGVLGIFGTIAATAAVLLYGAGNGLQTIARGTLPLALFGPGGYAGLMGRLALPALLAQAAGPLLVATVVADWPARATVAALAGLAAINALLMVGLWRYARATGPTET